MGNLENTYLKKEVSHLLRMTILDTWDIFYLDFLYLNVHILKIKLELGHLCCFIFFS